MRLINSSVYYHHQHHPSSPAFSFISPSLPPPRFCTPEPALLHLPSPPKASLLLSSQLKRFLTLFLTSFFFFFFIVIVARRKLWDFLPLFPRTELQLQLRREEDQLYRGIGSHVQAAAGRQRWGRPSEARKWHCLYFYHNISSSHQSRSMLSDHMADFFFFVFF